MSDRFPVVVDAGKLKEMPAGDAVPVSAGGTGATTVAAVRTNLSVGRFRAIITIAGAAYALGDTAGGDGACYLDCQNAAATTITFTDEATHGLQAGEVVHIRANGAGGFIVAEDPGVAVTPKLGGDTGSTDQFDLVAYLYKGGDEWDAN
jgi:hypothetical protein